MRPYANNWSNYQLLCCQCLVSISPISAASGALIADDCLLVLSEHADCLASSIPSRAIESVLSVWQAVRGLQASYFSGSCPVQPVRRGSQRSARPSRFSAHVPDKYCCSIAGWGWGSELERLGRHWNEPSDPPHSWDCNHQLSYYPSVLAEDGQLPEDEKENIRPRSNRTADGTGSSVLA